MRTAATKLLLATLTLFAILNLFAILYLQFRPESRLQASPAGFLEACRELCARYGLVESGDIAADARAFLAAARQPDAPNSALQTAAPVPSQEHPLLGKPAPDFLLPDDVGGVVRLADLNRRGPVVVVFYYGYSCSHCVAQLFAIDEELQKFSDLGAAVVALSADSPEHTAEKFAEYGRFGFPALSDQDRKVSIAYGCYRPATRAQEEDMLHGTFLVDRQGIVRWAHTGYEPYLDNESLLQILKSFASF